MYVYTRRNIQNTGHRRRRRRRRSLGRRRYRRGRRCYGRRRRRCRRRRRQSFPYRASVRSVSIPRRLLSPARSSWTRSRNTPLLPTIYSRYNFGGRFTSRESYVPHLRYVRTVVPT